MRERGREGIGYDMMTVHVRCDLILLLGRRWMGIGEKYAVLVRFDEKLFFLASRRCLEV